MKIFGHPIHIMLIHFPSALFPMDLACSLAAYYTGIKSLNDASYYAMLAGSTLGWLAVIAGTFDLTTVLKNKPGSIKKALIHGGINSTVLLAYTILTLMAFKKYPDLSGDSPSLLGFKTVLVTGLIIGNFIGGSLILKDKVLEKNPETL